LFGKNKNTPATISREPPQKQGKTSNRETKRGNVKSAKISQKAPKIAKNPNLDG
jgi:hypothetical protein